MNSAVPLSAHAERQKIPTGTDWSVEELADHFDKTHKKLDISKESVRQSMADAVTHDILSEISHNGSGISWYDVIPDAAMRYVADHVDSSILANPENTLYYKMAQAVSSNGQDVFANAETGYMAYKFWREHGELPTEQKDLVGGGIKHGAMTKTFAMITDFTANWALTA